MAEKGFGVKEINLIGASGTPTIESPNNLNLNAVNVAISTNVSIGGTLTVSGNLSIGGTITYEDVTNVDSIGIVTAREGVFIPDLKELKIGNTSSSPDLKLYHDNNGDSYISNATGHLTIRNNTSGKIINLQPKSGANGIIARYEGAAELYHNGNKKFETTSSGAKITGTATATASLIVGSGNDLQFTRSGGNTEIQNYSGTLLFGNASSNLNNVLIRGRADENSIICIPDGAVELYHNGTKTAETFTQGLLVPNTLGISFGDGGCKVAGSAGSGASVGISFMTNSSGRWKIDGDGHFKPSADSSYDIGLTGTRVRNIYADTLYGDGSNLTGIAVTEAPVTDYTVTANGSSAYRFHGGGVDETADDPDLYLIRGQKYRFNNTTGSSHPFALRVSSGGSAYSNGVTGSQNGIQFFTVPYDAPAKIFYQCTSHGGMVGNIYIRGANGQNDNVGVTTFSGAVNVTAAITADDFRTDSSSSTLYLTSANDWRFRTTSGNERVRITSTGNMKVGFVNNINPTTVFDVMASAINQDIVRFTGANYNRGLKISTAASGAINDALIKYDADSQNSAGQHAFLTDGTERLRIASDGVITGRGELRLTQGTSVVSNGDEIGSLMYLYPSNDNKNAKIVAIQNGGTSGADLAFYTRQQGDATNTDGGTEKLRITDSGRVGIMETSPQSPLQVKGGIRSAQTPGNGHIDLKHDGTNGSVTTSYGNFLFYNTNNSGSYIFHTTSSNSAKIEIKSDGKIAFNSGGTVNATYQFDYAPATGGIIVNANASFTGNATAIQFRTAPSTVSGSITLTNNGSTTAYVTVSDYRLKENETALTNSIARLKLLKPLKFNWKSQPDNIVDGFFAHEVATVVPDAVMGEKDAVDSDNNPIFQGLDSTRIIPLLTAALQEAITEIETLKTKVAALEGS